MEQESVARVMLVRAVEEVLPQRIAPETLLEARIAAGDPPEGETWIARRAATWSNMLWLPMARCCHVRSWRFQGRGC
jgi:hypothetical protein